MRILVLYEIYTNTIRNTINEHLFSFKKYAPEHTYDYVNVIDKIPPVLFGAQYDLIILHYTYLAGARFDQDDRKWNKKVDGLERILGKKVAIPQDEYDYTNRLWELFKRVKVDTVFTCFETEIDIRTAYPYEKTLVKNFETVFTGYVDENNIEKMNMSSRPYKDRPIDLGYRARKLPANYGKHGQLKYELVELFDTHLIGKGLMADIKNTNDILSEENLKVVKLGESWTDFLLSCKAFVGCEGGSSLLDPDGSIKEKVSAYEKQYPGATFQEIENACFPGLDYNISCFAISPRHFETAMAKTLQVLVEGNYAGIFLPNRHYLCLKRDFSNIDEVLNSLKNNELCQKLIDTAYEDIVISGKYTYRAFVQQVLQSAVAMSEIPLNLSGDINLKIRLYLHQQKISVLLNKNDIVAKIYNSPWFEYIHPFYRRFIKPLVRRSRSNS